MNPGDVVFQGLSLDPKSAAIAFHSVTLLHRPRYAHCGIYIGNGQMIAASGRVQYQDAGATGNIAIPYAWANWNVTKGWLDAQVGKPYDWFAWILCLLKPLLFFVHIPINTKTYTCSSLVAQAMILNGSTSTELRERTVTPDDIRETL